MEQEQVTQEPKGGSVDKARYVGVMFQFSQFFFTKDILMLLNSPTCHLKSKA